VLESESRPPVVSISTARATPSAFGLSHLAGACCPHAALPSADTETTTANAKAVRITISVLQVLLTLFSLILTMRVNDLSEKRRGCCVRSATARKHG
jgi:hypothetical protein